MGRAGPGQRTVRIRTRPSRRAFRSARARRRRWRTCCASAGCSISTAPVAKYWPEFAANGKEKITVADALAHRAGLNTFDPGRLRRDRGSDGLEAVHRGAGGDGAAVGAGYGDVLSRADLRLHRRRGDPAHHGQDAGYVLRARRSRGRWGWICGSGCRSARRPRGAAFRARGRRLQCRTDDGAAHRARHRHHDASCAGDAEDGGIVHVQGSTSTRPCTR